MAKISTTRRIIVWLILLAAVLPIALWRLGITTYNHAIGWGQVSMGLWIVLFACFGIAQPRLFYVVYGFGVVVWGLGIFLHSNVLVPIGSVIVLANMLVAALRRDTTPEMPLALTEDMRSKAGLPAETEGKGPALQVVLVDTGTKRRGVTGCLRRLYGPMRFERWSSIMSQSPTVLQRTTSRREAEFVAAQLANCGAQVDIVEAQDSTDVRGDTV